MVVTAAISNSDGIRKYSGTANSKDGNIKLSIGMTRATWQQKQNI